MYIIQRGSKYQLITIEEVTRKSELDANILRRNHNSENTDFNAFTLEKSIDKEVQHGWALTLTIESGHHAKYVCVVPLGVSN